MGWLDKAKALASEASDTGKRIVESVSDHVEEAASKDERVGKIVASAKELVSSGQKKIESKSDELSDTESGKKAGDAVRKIGKVVSSLPVISAAPDIIRLKNCVDLLVVRLQQEPNNPYANLWLAESLMKTSQDMSKYRYAKGAIDPSSFFIAGAMRKTAELGNDSIPILEKLLRHAWSLAIKNLRESPRDSEALDVLARVFLAKGDRDRAIATAKVAVFADPKNPLPRITLGRALLADGNFQAALFCGISAVRSGSTVGYLIAAEASQLESRVGNKAHIAERITAYEQMASKATDFDRTLYGGAYRDPNEIASATKASQTEKVRKTWSTAKRWGGLVRDA